MSGLPDIEREEERIENIAKCPWNEFVCLEEECQHFLESGNFYVTLEIRAEVECIRRGVSVLKLGYYLLHKNDTCSTSIKTNEFSASGVLATVHKSRLKMLSIKRRMNKCRLQDALDLDTRQAHHWTKLNLSSIEQDLAPFVKNAIQSLKEYCANIGVTDRFQGYRKNLNQPFKDPIICREFTNMLVSPRNKQVLCFDSQNINHECRMDSIKSIQERFGIMMCFPGITEYADTFTLPLKQNLFPYIINPIPNYNVDGRLMAKRIADSFDTNYSLNYQWPNATKLPMYPWLRQ